MNECFLKNVACGQSRRDDGIVSGRASNTKVPTLRAPPTLQYSNKGVWNGSFLWCQSYLKPTWAHNDVERYKEGGTNRVSRSCARRVKKQEDDRKKIAARRPTSNVSGSRTPERARALIVTPSLFRSREGFREFNTAATTHSVSLSWATIRIPGRSLTWQLLLRDEVQYDRRKKIFGKYWSNGVSSWTFF